MFLYFSTSVLLLFCISLLLDFSTSLFLLFCISVLLLFSTFVFQYFCISVFLCFCNSVNSIFLYFSMSQDFFTALDLQSQVYFCSVANQLLRAFYMTTLFSGDVIKTTNFRRNQQKGFTSFHSINLVVKWKNLSNKISAL